MQTGFWWGSLRERDNLADLRVDVKIILKYILRKQDRIVCNDFIRLRKGGGPYLNSQNQEVRL
jgi:hypothetical protein